MSASNVDIMLALLGSDDDENVEDTRDAVSSAPAVESRPAAKSEVAQAPPVKPASTPAFAKATGAKQDIHVDPVTRWRIVNRYTSSDIVEMKVRPMTIVPFAHVRRQATAPNDQNWALFGVIVSRNAKTTANGKKFLVWNLTDLKENTMKLLLFDKAANDLWLSATEGCVVCVANPEVLPDRGSDRGSASPAISITEMDQVLLIGQAMDFGTCKGRRKDGNQCTMPIDRSKGDYCVFHVKAAYKKMSNARMDLQHGGARNDFRSNHPAIRSKMAGVSVGGRYVPVCTREARVKRKQPDTPSVSVADAKENGLVCMQRSNSARKPIVNASTGRPLYLEKQIATSASNRPVLGRGMDGDDDDIDLDVTTSMKRAIVALGGRPVAKRDPNSAALATELDAMKGDVSRRSSDQLRQRFISTPPASRKLFGNLTMDSAEGQAILAQKSTNQHLVEKEDHDRLESRMDFMEQKEQLAEKMQTIRSQDVKTFICMQCHTTLQKQSEYCRSQGHKPLEAIAKKRFFKCRICHSRQDVLGKLEPDTNCTRCGQRDWARTSLYKGKDCVQLNDKLRITNEKKQFRE
ncbi:Protein MCM10 [Plasmodiophora brassicae]|nr:hypothetical protein PBRA_005286 [Plasmodiophora brassicae]